MFLVDLEYGNDLLNVRRYIYIYSTVLCKNQTFLYNLLGIFAKDIILYVGCLQNTTHPFDRL